MPIEPVIPRAMPGAGLEGWTSEQKHVVAATFLGWALDAFDFFLMVFVLTDIAKEFGTDITDVTVAILLTLAMRPIGAYLFGRAADRWGRRPTLMIDVLLYSAVEFATAFSPNHYGNDYGFALALVAGTVAVAIAILAAVGIEAKGIKFGEISQLPVGNRR